VFWPDLILMTALGVFTAGFTGYLIFGPLSFRHLQDREATSAAGAHAFAPMFWGYLLRGDYRVRVDRNLDALATPARIMLWLSLIGGIASVAAMLMRNALT
jgi:hypothetical protein